jgi:NAD(P)-dependent dehydrogenase (short-subunit alcohol dehydrogenase family)
MLRAAVEAFGAIDFAVNNAGIIGLQAPLDQYDDKTWDRVISINLTGVYHCLRAELDYFYGQGAGAIVNIASEASLRGSAADAVYTASKHGVAGLTKTTALEAVKKGVRINGVCPGSIETDLVRKFLAQNPEAAEHANNMMPIGRMGRPSEIGEAVAWLCSDAASLVAGHLLAVDGGWSAV